MANLERLLQVLQAGIEEPNLVMSSWRNDSVCGTAHCLFGSYVEKHEPEGFHFVLGGVYGDSYDLWYYTEKGWYEVLAEIAEHFEITNTECCFLFTTHYGKARQAVHLNREEALNRLRKFIIYKFAKYYEVPYYHIVQTVQQMFKYETIVDDMIKFITDFIEFHKAHE